MGPIAYGSLEHVIYDCQLDQYDKDERDLARAHVALLKEIGLTGSLMLFVRWCPSAEFIAFLYENGFPFVMRVRRKWNLEADLKKIKDIYTLLASPDIGINEKHTAAYYIINKITFPKREGFAGNIV